TDARPIGYGAMICEAALATLATMAVATGKWAGDAHNSAWQFIETQSASAGDGRMRLPQVGEALQAFVNGSAGFLESIGLPYGIAATVVAVLVISFAATSLDTALRIQRIVLAELGATYKIKPLQNRWIGGAVACGSVLALIYADYDQGAKSLWPVFGATNQVLAALTLLLCALYLRAMGRKTLAYILPACIVMVVTFAAMGIQVTRDIAAGKIMVSIVGGLIAVLTLWVALEGALAWRRGESPKAES
ncbi:MAG: carbon starvation protein, partial [Planctomycetota bacterium]